MHSSSIYYYNHKIIFIVHGLSHFKKLIKRNSFSLEITNFFQCAKYTILHYTNKNKNPLSKWNTCLVPRVFVLNGFSLFTFTCIINISERVFFCVLYSRTWRFNYIPFTQLHYLHFAIRKKKKLIRRITS